MWNTEKKYEQINKFFIRQAYFHNNTPFNNIVLDDLM